jgi:hypothetical protein
MAKTRVPLLFGTMTIGDAGKNGVRNSDPKEVQDILDTYFSYGHTELDTARMYAEGTTEEVCPAPQIIRKDFMLTAKTRRLSVRWTSRMRPSIPRSTHTKPAYMSPAPCGNTSSLASTNLVGRRFGCFTSMHQTEAYPSRIPCESVISSLRRADSKSYGFF